MRGLVSLEFHSRSVALYLFFFKRSLKKKKTISPAFSLFSFFFFSLPLFDLVVRGVSWKLHLKKEANKKREIKRARGSQRVKERERAVES